MHSNTIYHTNRTTLQCNVRTILDHGPQPHNKVYNIRQENLYSWTRGSQTSQGRLLRSTGALGEIGILAF